MNIKTLLEEVSDPVEQAGLEESLQALTHRSQVGRWRCSHCTLHACTQLKNHTHRCVHNVSNKDVFNETALSHLLNGKIITLLHFYIML